MFFFHDSNVLRTLGLHDFGCGKVSHLAYEGVSFSLRYHLKANSLSFECFVCRYMDKYARLMQIMQPIATDVFKVCCGGLQYCCFHPGIVLFFIFCFFNWIEYCFLLLQI